MIPMHTIHPPLLNAPSLWSTTYAQLRELYFSPHTGAITTRTTALKSTPTPPAHHTTHFDSATLATRPDATSSIHNHKASPYPLSTYLAYTMDLVREASRAGQPPKPIILSVPARDIQQAYATICAVHKDMHAPPLAIEVNLGDAALERGALRAVLETVAAMVSTRVVPVGLKLPPLTSAGQMAALRDELVRVSATGTGCPASFLTSVGGLGCCAIAENGGGFVEGEVGGAAVHALALGNVRALKRMVEGEGVLAGVLIIGVGGVGDGDGARRMRMAGADVVGVGTAVGVKGVGVFEEIGAWLE